jgi:indole-3-glycerol phosphate synthase
VIGTVLEKIVAQTRRDLAARMQQRPLSSFETKLAPSEKEFGKALVDGCVEGWPALIAEFKPKSPSRGSIREGATPTDVIPIYDAYASCVSVLCDAPFFGGSYETLRRARALTERPMICKDFIVERYQIAEAREAGADAVLLMATVLEDPTLSSLYAFARSLGMDALVETHDQPELDRVLAQDFAIVGVNSRDLKTLEIDRDRMIGLLSQVPATRVRVAESGVDRREDVAAVAEVADAVLIGSALMAAESPQRAIEELGWRCE